VLSCGKLDLWWAHWRCKRSCTLTTDHDKTTGGKLANNETIVNIGLALNEGCWNTYASDACVRLQYFNATLTLSRTGIGPEAFAYISSDGNFTGGSPPTAEQLAFYKEHGFYITDSDYIERPEVLESNFYAWRATGDTKYLDRAASAVNSFNRFLKTNSGFASISNVNSLNNTRIDDMESFWFAEVLKVLSLTMIRSDWSLTHSAVPVRMAYAAELNMDWPSFSYLTFDDPSHISLDDCQLSSSSPETV
jgi:hypothetical protein